MQKLITEKVARQITGGRKPFVMIEYERAVKDLALCQTIDEAKYFADKSDALAAFAAMVQDDRAGLEAKRLKLHAYRKMGQLASELRPRNHVALKGGGFRGSEPGPKSLLHDAGLSHSRAQSARALAIVPADRFDALVRLPNPPSPHSAVNRNLAKGSDAWKKIAVAGGGCPMIFRSFCRSNPAKELATGIQSDEIPTARSLIRECIEWLEEFDHHLPKAVPRK